MKTATKPARFKERGAKLLPSGMFESEQMKRVEVPFEAREVNKERLQVEFVISNYNIDSYGTRFDPNGMNLTQYTRNPLITYRHMRDGGWFSLPIGRGLVNTIKKDAQGNIRMTVEFTPEETFPIGFQIYKLVRDGYLRMGSIGADAIREEIVTEADGRKTLVFREWMLYEFAIVPIGSNDDALATQRLSEINLTREDLVLREKEVAEFISREDTDDAHLLAVVEILREDKPEEKKPMDDDKVCAECYSTDEGTYINVKIKREKDGKPVEYVHRDCLFVPVDGESPVSPSESAEQKKHREYFEKNQKVFAAYRDFMAKTYKSCAIKQPADEREAVDGLTTLFGLASTPASMKRDQKPRSKLDREGTKRLFTKLVKDVLTGTREALLSGAPVRDFDDLVAEKLDDAISSI